MITLTNAFAELRARYPDIEPHSRRWAWETGCECPSCIYQRIDERERERRAVERDTEDRRQS